MSQVYQFKNNPFTFQQFIKKTSYKKSYGRNLINKLSKMQILEVLPNDMDKRTRLYKLNWKKIIEFVIQREIEKDIIFNNLNLEKYLHEYVALKNFEVLDHDIDLIQLTQRIFKNGDEIGFVTSGGYS
ncbi:MAG: hypothetical protein ACFFDN_15970, partial [Candidatus Hodarchaeota archaeon]